ncbi:MAG: hypothetical protein IJA72_00365, partial [Clostridia bacterium]|nr:hypothetical protein [Clostridia bacterium]
MYDYLINGNISANAKSFISSYISQKTLINASQYLPESQLTDSEFQSEATEIKYHIRDKQYTFKDEVVFSNFMTTRSSYFDSVMQGVDYTNILSSPNVGTTDFHYEDGERILSENPRISYNHTEDYKTYLSMQAYSANRNVILSSKYEYERGFIRDGNNKYKI